MRLAVDPSRATSRWSRWWSTFYSSWRTRWTSGGRRRIKICSFFSRTWSCRSPRTPARVPLKSRPTSLIKYTLCCCSLQQKLMMQVSLFWLNCCLWGMIWLISRHFRLYTLIRSDRESSVKMQFICWEYCPFPLANAVKKVIQLEPSVFKWHQAFWMGVGIYWWSFEFYKRDCVRVRVL